MFTGLVEKIGTVKRVSRGRGLVIEFAFDPWLEPLVPGESVAVNGTCLTVARCDSARFTADVLRETELRTGLAELKPGDKVNLERAMKANSRLGGHIVQGHVDGRGKLIYKTPKGRDFALTFHCGRVIACACVEKGSIAVNGVSLTVSGIGDDWFRVDVIPTTLRETNLGFLKVGDSVNLETDVLGKYARKGFGADETGSEPRHGSGLTMETLIENGFV
jgi:riboflavin synthase